jgi:response regulator RpfG family c-di-GMP phosphodiesterase
MRKILLFSFVVSIFIFSGCSNARNQKVPPEARMGILDLREWNFKEDDRTIELQGEWEFYWEKFLYQSDFNKPSEIEKTGYFNLPGTWNDYLINGKKLPGTGFATYRLRLLLNETFTDLAIKVLPIQTASSVYINGKLFGSAGISGKNKETSNPGYKPMMISFEPDTTTLDIIVHVSNFDHRQGGIWGTMIIGSEIEMMNQLRIYRDRDFFIIGSIIIMGIYYLSLYFIHKKSKEAIFFSLFCLTIVLRILVTGDIFLLSFFPAIKWKTLIFIEYTTFFASLPLIVFFVYALFKNRILRNLAYLTALTGGLFSILTLFTPVWFSSHLIPFYQILTLFSGCVIFYSLIRLSLKKEKLALIILTGFIIMFISTVNDILYAADIISSTYTISFGILLFIIFQSIVMTSQFAKSFNEVERQQKQLMRTNMEYRHEINERIRLEEDLHISYQKNAKSRLAIIMGLAKLAEYRDSDTGAHIERIQEFTSLLAEELQRHPDYKDYITDEYIEDLHISSILHDIGKVGIPDAILRKPGKLTFEEFEIMKNHSQIGGDSIKTVEIKTGVRSFLTLAKEIAYMHHERWDGSGYPRGLKGHEIPFSARLTALADVYDALTAKRCYKEAFTHEVAKNIIIESRGTHFDPLIVDAFLAIENQFDRIRSALQDEMAYET